MSGFEEEKKEYKKKDPLKKISKWNASTAVKGSAPLAMAEPLHRITPPGASSHQSVRTVSKSALQLVKEICLHYVEKSTGQYANNKAAARYVHQMAEEIIFQLGGVASEIKRTRGEPEMYQALLDEWNEHFPPSLGAMGSPRAIAQLVASQTKEISKLKAELDTERLQRENDVTGILRSMDAQLHTYRNSVMSDRKHQKQLFEQKLNASEDAIRSVQSAHSIELEDIDRRNQAQLVSIQKHYETLFSRFEAEKVKAQQDHDLAMRQQRAKYHDRIDRLREALGHWEDKCKELRSKYNELAVAVSDELILTDDHEPDALLDIHSDSDSNSEFDLDVDLDASANGDVDMSVDDVKNKISVARQERREQMQQKQIALKAKRSQEQLRRSSSMGEGNGLQTVNSLPLENVDVERLRQLQESNTILQAQVRKMEKKCNASDQESRQCKEEVVALTDKLQELLQQRTEHIQKISSMEQLSDALRHALAAKVDNNGCLCFDKVQLLKTVPDVLCHTPHFLDRPDRTSPQKKNPNPISAYKTIGHF